MERGFLWVGRVGDGRHEWRRGKECEDDGNGLEKIKGEMSEKGKRNE